MTFSIPFNKPCIVGSELIYVGQAVAGGHALGPAPLAFDEEHARRVADLTLYIRQHHGDRDLAALGHAVSAADS